MNEAENNNAAVVARVKPGSQFNRWTVLAFTHKVKKNKYWMCRCQCGTEKIIGETTFRYGGSKSCGCLRNEELASRATHGQSSNGGTHEYHCWAGMIQRCLNPKHPAFENYGGRGIRVCDRWRSFENFFEDMGRAPTKLHSIDRWPDKNGNYESINSRWATDQQQAENKRNNVLLTYAGETLVMGAMAVKHGLNRSVVKGRLKRGWSVEKALETPIQHNNRWHHKKLTC